MMRFEIDARDEIEFETHRDMVLGRTGDPFENDPEYAMAHDQPDDEEGVTSVRVVAEYQLMSDEPGRTWMREVLGYAQLGGHITGSRVSGCYPGRFGLQLVTFHVDLSIGVDQAIKPDMSRDQAKAAATALLNQIVGDSDVEVRWLATIR